MFLLAQWRYKNVFVQDKVDIPMQAGMSTEQNAYEVPADVGATDLDVVNRGL